MHSPSNFFTVLAKPTGRCNLRCTFCYQDFNEMARGRRMPPDVLEKLIERVCEHPSQNVSLQWIGGESLAVGPDFYQRCENLIRQHEPSGKYISSSIQTNGTLIDQDWIKFFSSNRRHALSISFEVMPHLQNALRPGRGRYAETYPRVADALEMLRKAGVSFGILTVVERDTLDVEPAEWLNAVVEHGIRKIGLQLSYKNVYTGDLAMVERYLDWIDALFECQAAYNSQCTDPGDILLIRESFYLFNLIRRPKMQIGSCHNLSTVCTDFLVSVDEEGRVYGHCDSFMGTRRADGGLHVIGNIFDASFTEMLAGDGAGHVRQQLAKGREKCRSCGYFSLCRGGCGFFKALQAGDIASGCGDSIESYCALTIGLMKHVTTPAKRRVILDSYRPLLAHGMQQFHFVKPAQEPAASVPN